MRGCERVARIIPFSTFVLKSSRIKTNYDYEDEQRQLSTIFEYDKDLAMNFDYFLDNPGLHLIAHLTFGYLDFSSVERCRRVSKKWKEFLENETDYQSQAFEEIDAG